MKNPENLFKNRLGDTGCQLGLWNTIGGNTVPEMLGGAGFDWVLVDCEHAAIEAVEVLPALQTIGQHHECPAVVRPASNDPVLFKRLLDMGAQTLLVPYVQTAEEAEIAVRAKRYAPAGMRGAAGMTRATRYGQLDDYIAKASEQLCLVVQIESAMGLENLDSIATTEGVDAVFIGPYDLSISLGYKGDVAHPNVLAAIDDAISRVTALGVPWGIMSLTPEAAKGYISKGASFVAAGVDLVLLAEAVNTLRGAFSD